MGGGGQFLFFLSLNFFFRMHPVISHSITFSILFPRSMSFKAEMELPVEVLQSRVCTPSDNPPTQLSVSFLDTVPAASNSFKKRKSFFRRGSSSDIVRRSAAMTIQNFFRLHIAMPSRLRRIRQSAAASKFQAVFRSYMVRLRGRDWYKEQQRQYILRSVIPKRPVTFATCQRYRLHLAALRIQQAWKRCNAVRQRRRRLEIARGKIILHFFRRIQFYRFLKMAPARLAHRDLMHRSVTKIQSLVRSRQAQQRFVKCKRTLLADGAKSFLKAERSRLRQRVPHESRALTEQIQRMRETNIERDVLALVLSSDHPNRDVMQWSTALAYNSNDIQYRGPLLVHEPLTMVRADGPDKKPAVKTHDAAAFQFDPQVLQPSTAMLAKTRPSPLRRVKLGQVSREATRRVTRRRSPSNVSQLVDNVSDNSFMTRFVLTRAAELESQLQDPQV